jgi:two-component system response regulator YesN
MKMYRLLVVDDDEIICRGIAGCIDWASYDIGAVECAFDGELALEAIEAAPFDIAIVDMCMPFMDDWNSPATFVSVTPTHASSSCRRPAALNTQRAPSS